MKPKIDFSLEMIKQFHEYDSTITFKNATFDYINAFKIGFDSEFGNWILLIQHAPDDNKTQRVYNSIIPFAERIKKHEIIWKDTRRKFMKKYNIENP